MIPAFVSPSETAAARTAHLTAAGVRPPAAVTAGYAWALGGAGLALALLILPILAMTDNHDPKESL